MTTGDTTWSRRGFLTGAAAIGVAGRGARPAAAELPPETTKLRLLKETGRTCWAPQYVAEDLLRSKGSPT